MKTLKAMLVNGSPHETGVCGTALLEVKDRLEKQGIECELIQLGTKDIHGCIACGYCSKHGKCVFNDIVNETAPLFEEADALIVASPTYYAGVNSTLFAYMTRMFYSTPFDKSMKVGAAIASARRAGTLPVFDQLNHFFTIAQMPVASSRYWNNVFGSNGDQARLDHEGISVCRQLANNTAFLMKSIALGKETFGAPEQEERAWTNFIMEKKEWD